MSNTDWAGKDFYAVLGVAQDAEQSDIKKAYRRLARDNHPDSHPGDTTREEKFKQVAEAYHVLGDAERRKEYDQLRSMFGSGGFPGGGFPGGGFPGGGRPGPQGQNIDLEDLLGQQGGLGGLFGDLFGGGGGGAQRGRRTRRPQRGHDIETTARIGFLDALEGTTISLRLTSETACSTCHGTGGKPGTQPSICPTCDGTGQVLSTAGGGFSMAETCPRCAGRQLVYDQPCPTCMGSGRGSASSTVSARIPAGVKDGQRIRVKGKGAPGDQGGSAGDLYVTVAVTRHEVFRREGDSIVVELPVRFDEAALGATLKAPTPAGSPVTLKLPPGSSSGRRLRVRGRGAPRKDGSRGDLLVELRVEVPTTLSDEARAAVEAYREAMGEHDPRTGMAGER